jgi:ABC-2 type transport system permease protein
MQKYLQVAKIAITYRMAYISRILGPLLFDGLFLAFYIILWKALYAGKSNLAGYSFSSVVLYYVLDTVLKELFKGNGITNVYSIDIKDGLLSNSLVKPISYNGYTLLILAIYNFFRFLTPALVFVILTVKIPGFATTTDRIFPFVLSVICSMLLSYLFAAILGSIAFWTVNTWGVVVVVNRVTSILKGSLVPLEFLPATLLVINNFLPFRYMNYSPIAIYLGKLSGNAIYLELFYQLIWLITLFWVYKFLWSKGVKNYESTGI